jgi:carboxylate-amine ligase
VAVDTMLEENRFVAARDGMAAELMDLADATRHPAASILAALLPVAREHAEDLGCAAELDGAAALAVAPGADRQRRLAEARGGPGTVAAALAAQFV